MSREPEVFLRDYWNVVNEYKWRIVAFAAAATVLAVLAVSAMTPVYTASAEILIEAQDANIVSTIEDVYGLEERNAEYYETQIGILSSRPLAERVIADLNIVNHPEYALDNRDGVAQLNLAEWLKLPTWLQSILDDGSADGQFSEALALAQVVDGYRENLSVSLIGRSQLVKVEFSSSDPVLAADVANAQVKAYTDSMLDTRFARNDSAETWMQQQLAELESKMLESEARLQEYREQEQLIDSEGLKSLPAAEINDLNMRLVQVRSELSQARIAYTQVYQGSSRPLDDLRGVPAVLEDNGVQDLQNAEAQAQRKVAEYARRYGPQHTAMIAAQAELAKATENLRRQQMSVAKSIENRYEAVRAEEQELVRALGRAKQKYQDVGRKESGLMALQREADTNRNLYEVFYTRLTETTVTDDIITVPVRIISPAVVPIKPTRPQKPLIVALVFVTSFLLGLLAAFVAASMRSTIKSADDVENLGLELLAMVPLLRVRKKGNSLRKASADNTGALFKEAIRTIRAGIAMNSTDNPNRVILVTSPLPTEGKSTVAMNLAIAFAGTEKEKVLLIDADIRRPSLAKEFGLRPDRPGFSELISGKAKFLQCLVRRDAENLDLLPAGIVLENPLGSLSSHQVKQLFQALRTRYDRIIIDSPPLLPVSDGAVLSTYADSVMVVLKSDVTTVKEAQEAVKKLRRANATIAGAIINQVDLKKLGYYRAYGLGGYLSDFPAPAKV